MALQNDSLLVYVPSPPPADWAATMAARFPGLRARWIQAVPAAPGKGGGLVEANDLPAETWHGVTLLCIYHVPRPELIPHVRFVQLASAGSDLWAAHPKYLDPRVPFCTAGGCQPPQIAEWVLAAWLSHTHRFDHFAAQQRAETWSQRTDLGVTDSRGLRMGILGYGAIGRQCARLAKALGMQVYAYTQRARPTAASRALSTYSVPGTGDPEGRLPDAWFSGGDVDAFLAQDLDVLVISVPLTDATRGLVGAAQLRLLGSRRKNVFVANVARGAVVDTDALEAALRAGVIGGAAVDVTDPEPLPPGHSLWSAPNLRITPHVAWYSTNYITVMSELLMENLTRLAEGRDLINPEKKPGVAN